MASVDTTDVPFQQIKYPHPKKPGKMVLNKALFSWKLEGPGLRYEIALSILSNDIVWINGPFAPGDWNDIEIFRQGLIHQLDPDERIEADDIYFAEAPRYVVCPKSMFNIPEERNVWRRRVQGRHEVLNNHVKFWTCLTKPFIAKGTPAEKMIKHNNTFRACCVVKQLSMEMGVGELYDIGDDYDKIN
jgi:hypothetical protein